MEKGVWIAIGYLLLCLISVLWMVYRMTKKEKGGD